MTFGAPVFVWAAAAASVFTVALHLLAWRRPPATALPTARFAPDVPVRTVSRALRPSDLVLLALRVVVVMLVGVALGRPTWSSKRAGGGRVVVVDQSHRPRVSAAVVDSARAQFRPGDVLVAFDSLAREVANATADSIGPPRGAPTDGSVSAGLVVAIRAARRLIRERDSVEIVLVSPVTVNELDAATAVIRQAWDGPVRVVRVVGPPDDSAAVGRVIVRAARGDPVAAALTLTSQARAGGDVRVVRDEVTASDSAWARQGHTLVAWPSSVDAGWPLRARPDTAYAVSMVQPEPFRPAGLAAATLVAALPRGSAPPPGRIVARWQDGEPAATEAALGAGCVRAVAVAVPAAGDLALTPAFRRLAEHLTTPCRRMTGSAPVADTVVAAILPTSAQRGTPSVSRATSDVAASRLTAWLLAIALGAALAEVVVRRGANATA